MASNISIFPPVKFMVKSTVAAVVVVILFFILILREKAYRENKVSLDKYTIEIDGVKHSGCTQKGEYYYTKDGGQIHFGKESYIVTVEK